MLGIYLHIPFCNSKCAYCNFYSFKSNESKYNEYTKVLCSHLSACKGLSLTADTLYIGGGTPSCLGGDRLASLIHAAKDSFSIRNGQITVEVNPAVNIKDDLQKMFDAGANRISFGVQSAVQNELDIIGRKHKNEDVIRSIKDAKDVGFQDISVDLMIGLPNQTLETLKISLDFILSLTPTHISCYMLKIEDGTKLSKIGEDSLNLPNEDEVCDMYDFVSKYLSEQGFEHYEISNFAKPGFQSKHNNKYWNCEEYLGFGPSAHSFFHGKRFYFENDLNKYLTSPTPIYDGIGGDAEEYVMLRLRLSDGLSQNAFVQRFGFTLSNEFVDKVKYFEKLELMMMSGDKLCLTEKGFLVSSTIISDLVDLI